MIGLDTNVLVRYLTQDDPDQARVATTMMAQLSATDPGFVSREVMVELVWVLQRAYGLSRGQIAQTVISLLEAEDLLIEAPDRVGAAAVAYAKGGCGFADQMIRLASVAAGASVLVAFDTAAAAQSGVRLLV